MIAPPSTAEQGREGHPAFASGSTACLALPFPKGERVPDLPFGMDKLTHRHSSSLSSLYIRSLHNITSLTRVILRTQLVQMMNKTANKGRKQSVAA